MRRPPHSKPTLLMKALTFADIHLLWSERVKIVSDWLHEKSISPRFEILIPNHEITLEEISTDADADADANNFSNYLKSLLASSSGSRSETSAQNLPILYFVPMQYQARWITVMVSVQHGIVTSATCSDSFLSEKILNQVIKRIDVMLQDDSVHERYNLLNEFPQKHSKPLPPEYANLPLTALNAQIHQACSATDQAFCQRIYYFTDDTNASAFVAMENALALIKTVYYPELGSVISPTWITPEAIVALRAEYQTLPGIRFHPKTRFSAQQELMRLWERLKTDVIDYLEIRLISHREFFQEHGGITETEADHFFRFFATLSQFRETLQTAERTYSH